MYVCVCKAVDETELSQLIESGAQSPGVFEHVQKTCGAGTDCGACRLKIERKIQSFLAASQAPPRDERGG